MKLFPKARPVRIKLNVGGEEHSSLDSLRANFNVEEVLKLYASGGLQNWLRQINRLDILDQMDKIYNTDSDIEKYRKCILIFFNCPDIEEILNGNLTEEEKWSIDEILIDWHDKYPASFKFLMYSIFNIWTPDETEEQDCDAIPSVEFPLSVKTVKVIFDKALERRNNELQHDLSKYLYDRVRSTLIGIMRIRLKSIENSHSILSGSEVNDQTNDEGVLQPRREKLLQQLREEWNIEAEVILNPEYDLQNALNAMVENNMMKDYKDELYQIVISNRFDHERALLNISVKERDLWKETIEFVKSATRDIRIGNILTHDYGMPFFELKASKKALTITKKWNELPYIIQCFDESCSLDMLMVNWGKLCVYVYLYTYIYEFPKMNNIQARAFLFKHSVQFLNQNKGKNGLNGILETVRSKCNKKTIEHVTGMRRKLFQSALLIGVLCSDDKRDRIASLRVLHESGYIPASLMLRIRPPKNELEKAFLNLDHLERIPFIAEHILDF